MIHPNRETIHRISSYPSVVLQPPSVQKLTSLYNIIWPFPTSMKYMRQIRLILIYREFPRLALLLLTKPNIHSCLSELMDSRDTILSQGGLREGGRAPLPIGAERGPVSFGSIHTSCYKMGLARFLRGGGFLLNIVFLEFVNSERYRCILGLVNSKSFNLENSP